MMRPEDVPDEWVEKAAIAVQEAQNVPFVGVKQRKITRHALAAVLPEVQARALTEVADKLESVPDYTGTIYDQGRVDQRHRDALVLHGEAAHLRAAHLTDTTTEETA